MKRKNKFALFCITFLCFQLVTLPFTIGLSTSAQAVENTATIDSSTTFNEQLKDKPIFSFQETQATCSTGEVFTLVMIADQEVTEAAITLPEETAILDDELAHGITVKQGLEKSQIEIKMDVPQKVFSLPLVFEQTGVYTITLGEAMMTLEIVSEESSQENKGNEVTDSSSDDKKEEETIESPSSEKELPDAPILNEPNQELSQEANDVEVNSDNLINVGSWVEFIEAFSNPSISTIEIIDDFEVPTTPLTGLTGMVTGSNSNVTGGATFVYLTRSNISRKLDINGNGHQIDFGAVSLGLYPATHNANSPWDITFNDLDVYSGNWWGFFQTTNLTIPQHALSNITLHNINGYGNELIAPYYTNVNISGTVSNYITATYSSKFRTDWRVYTVNSVNLETRSLTIKEDGELNLSTVNSGNIIIGLGGLNANLTLEKNATINMESNGTGTGDNANGRGSSIDIANGDLIMKEGSTINIDNKRSYSAITLRSSNSTLKLEDSAKINIESTGHTNNSNAIDRNLVYMAAGSSLLVGENAEFNINATGRGSATSNIVHVAGNANFKIAKDGSLDIKSDSTSISQSLLNFASAGSTFEFSDAKKVNLERTTPISGSTSNGLISIAGTTGLLDIDVQSVKQWDRDNFTEEPDYFWTPIFNLILRYNTINPTITNVSSIFQETMTSFNESFTTRDVQRILFEKIPDVEVNIDPLTEDPMEVNSYTITGKASPNSVIRFSGDPALPEGAIQSPDFSESEKYHVTADDNGDYHYDLPQGSFFTEGNEVTAYAYLNGKSASASTVVEKSRRPPNPKDPLKPDEEVAPENVPELSEEQGLLSIDFVSRISFGQQGISTQIKNYYAQPQRLLNSDGTVNVAEERPNYVQISDRRDKSDRHGWVLSVTQNKQFINLQKQELKGARLQLTNQQLASVQDTGEPELSQADGITLLPGEKTKLLTSQSGQGAGTWIYRFGDSESAGKSIALEVPPIAAPKATTYKTTLTWEVSAVPDN
ncbi:WxL domain-containing protein [Enterococcus mundtii]|uniref:WxL domain-containing protein n=1 Tax=Enterococcus mundtii TaxID=53346 RepID=UPI001378DE43|nr:WxL domain-containing protein [Enterococcus mundtii]NBA63776.1 WxL domain-containing protein [Enterococcus mundtii]